MFRRIEAYHYRSLKSVDQTLGPFEILVGPNGSGKSSFLDVIAFLSTRSRLKPSPRRPPLRERLFIARLRRVALRRQHIRQVIVRCDKVRLPSNSFAIGADGA